MVFSFSSLSLAAGVSSVVGPPLSGVHALALVHAVAGTHAFASVSYLKNFHQNVYGMMKCCLLYPENDVKIILRSKTQCKYLDLGKQCTQFSDSI
jgi:hypothetical protein